VRRVETAFIGAVLLFGGVALALASVQLIARSGDPRLWRSDSLVAAAIGGALGFILLGSELASWFIGLRPIPAGLRPHLPTLWKPTGPSGERLPTESLDDLFGPDSSRTRRLIAMGVAIFHGFLYLTLLVPLHSTLALRARADLQHGWTVPGLLAGFELLFAASWVAFLAVRSRSRASADSGRR
jgi:hypothetical protein